MNDSHHKVFIIAEAGVNHNGSLEMAHQLLEAAHAAGADAVKFQTFKAENLVTHTADKADYQKQTTGSKELQFAMLKRLELSHDAHLRLIAHARQLGIEFMSTAFDMDSLKFLVNELGIQILKISSGEITNAPLLLAHARTGKRLIVSTGMATLAEVETALAIIAFGLIAESNARPSIPAFNEAYCSDAGQLALRHHVTLLHCTTEYPAPPSEINLQAMKTMRNAFGLSVGYSDHSEGIAVPIAAVALGAIILEKHFTLDKTLEGPDHKASIDVNELFQLVKSVRCVEAALGNGIKIPQVSELRNLQIARKSIVAATSIRKGQVYSEDNLAIKRPGSGMSPLCYWGLLGKPADHDYNADDMISG